MSAKQPLLKYEAGTLILENPPLSITEKLPDLKWDKRTTQWRAQGCYYKEIILSFYNAKIPLQDEARDYKKLEHLALAEDITPRKHQKEALQAWLESYSSGVVSLPTGAGKTILAVLAIAKSKRPALVVVPTIDLLHQWNSVLSKFFKEPIGMIGGGSKEIHPITVSTYDSAVLHIEYIGNKFGLLVFDECHHLPAPQYQFIARAAISPFRLGLSATVERSDGQESVIFDLVGEMVYEAQITEMVDKVLAPYDVINVQIPLSEEDYQAYQKARGIYTSFIRKNRISFSRPTGWMEFIRKSSASLEGKEAMQAYLKQKKLAQRSEAKIEELWRIISEHPDDSIIIFTDDNELAYNIGKEFVLPVLTHQTKAKERKNYLEAFRDGTLKILVTSRVLNEGVDVPEANIGIVVSGTGTVREHVQRLGRILRHQPEKRATLYELVSKDTSEFYVNQRRKQHNAYQRSTPV